LFHLGCYLSHFVALLVEDEGPFGVSFVLDGKSSFFDDGIDPRSGIECRDACPTGADLFS
jgi:hypothetical protein